MRTMRLLAVVALASLSVGCARIPTELTAKTQAALTRAQDNNRENNRVLEQYVSAQVEARRAELDAHLTSLIPAAIAQVQSGAVTADQFRAEFAEQVRRDDEAVAKYAEGLRERQRQNDLATAELEKLKEEQLLLTKRINGE